jgi:hypothetical protein
MRKRSLVAKWITIFSVLSVFTLDYVGASAIAAREAGQNSKSVQVAQSAINGNHVASGHSKPVNNPSAPGHSKPVNNGHSPATHPNKHTHTHIPWHHWFWKHFPPFIVGPGVS